MLITITLEDRQWATILGALQFWGEENAPGGDSTTQPYLETVGGGVYVTECAGGGGANKGDSEGSGIELEQEEGVRLLQKGTLSRRNQMCC
ncbi:hypothetical protein [Calycomorphotria hydatis]|uniref:Uncharacterized protein n=1 Tax=Calycomorphotria hydatis TaxID=2528027 RepID=A0A517TD84_9PLAN|nr:hypothetical protein [Calycomorphotria hydatis]QDT66335.1 hypothetical protein V22_36010 [Calycomorphotria hydatis]